MGVAPLNGHAPAPAARPLHNTPEVTAAIEAALAQMMQALAALGFSEYEAGMVNMTTRAAITGVAKECRRR